MTGRADLALKREELMDRIRQAAILEFAENGLRGASTQAIAERAGISKTKLHYYITGKEELYQDALQHIIEVWSDLFLSVSTENGPEAFLRDYIARKVHHAIAHPEVARLFSNEVMRGAPLMRAHWTRSRLSTQAAARRIREWIAAGLIRPVDPLLLQFNIWALTQHYALHAAEVRIMLDLDEDSPLDADRIIEEVTQLVLRGLRP